MFTELQALVDGDCVMDYSMLGWFITQYGDGRGDRIVHSDANM